MVSVVIATLGGDKILKTISHINGGSIIPEEILVCIPDDIVPGNSELENIPNVKIVRTPGRGQVFQRSKGFEAAQGDYVLQIDDDCILEPNCIAVLLKKIEEYPFEVAVAPVLYDTVSNKSLHARSDSQLYETFLSILLNGTFSISPGTITKAGVNFGVDFNKMAVKTIETQWLPGGCVLHKKANLVFDNFFPFIGKAYCEDLIHSYFLRKKGIKLILTSEAICRTSLDGVKKNTFRKVFKDTMDDHRARRYYMNLEEKPSVRINAYLILNLISKFYKSL